MALNEELAVIDQAISDLENKRTLVINRMQMLPVQIGPRLVQFPRPGAIQVKTYKSAFSHIW